MIPDARISSTSCSGVLSSVSTSRSAVRRYTGSRRVSTRLDLIQGAAIGEARPPADRGRVGRHAARIVSGRACNQTTRPHARIAARFSSRMGTPPPAASTKRSRRHKSAVTSASRSRNTGSPFSAKIRAIDLPARRVDLYVGVDRLPAEPFGQQASQRRLARRPVSDEDQVHSWQTLDYGSSRK